MNIALWPIVSRAQLVQTFRPGESAEKEAPFRTLRNHGWATSGVRIATRTADRASGRISIFSVLNIEAARHAREGDFAKAKSVAKAAADVEKSASFAQLEELLSGESLSAVTAALQGAVSAEESPELLDALRSVAHATRRLSGRERWARFVTGVICATRRDQLVLRAENGDQTLVPLWLAQSARREHVGDLLALVTDKLETNQLMVNAMPAIDLNRRTTQTTSPFVRIEVHALTKKDARLLSGSPVPPRVIVPVTIGR